MTLVETRQDKQPVPQEIEIKPIFPSPMVKVGDQLHSLYGLKTGSETADVFQESVTDYKCQGFYTNEAGEKIDRLLVYTTVNQKRVDALVAAAGGDIYNPDDQMIARTMLPFGTVSATAAAMGNCDWNIRQPVGNKNSNIPLYVGLKAENLSPVGDGILVTNLTLAKVGRTSIMLDHEQYQQGDKPDETVKINTGESAIVFKPYFDSGEQPAERKQADLTDFQQCGLARIISKRQLAEFSSVSGDYNRAHTDDEYMQESRFHCNRIIQGQLVVVSALIDAVGYARDRGNRNNLSSVEVVFNAPIVAEEAVIVAFIKPEDEGYRVQVVDQNGQLVIDLSFALN